MQDFLNTRSLIVQIALVGVASIVLGTLVAYLGVTLLTLKGVLTLVVAVICSAVLPLALLLLLVHQRIVQPMEALSSLTGLLARDGDLSVARTALQGVTFSGGENELSALRENLELLVKSHEHIARQAQTLALDDLFNKHLDVEGRGDVPRALRSLSLMLRDLSQRVKQVADGHLDSQADLLDGDVGSLRGAFVQMTNRLAELVNGLSNASSRIDSSARSLQAASRDQAASATQQAAAITETMATMEELAASSGHIADIAKNVVVLADESLSSAELGNKAVRDVGTGMNQIVAATQQGAERLLDLGEKSRSIGKVADLITGIAEQSKFLALNAAIEAARAGEAGRGFAVVAEEVRNLANHVVESTSEIEGLIAEIQAEIEAAVQASEEGVSRAEEGRDLAKRAEECLERITDITTRSTDAARQIQLATNQQRSASTQVATAVREVAGASEEVASGAKRVTGYSNELAELAHELQEKLHTFEAAPKA